MKESAEITLLAFILKYTYFSYMSETKMILNHASLHIFADVDGMVKMHEKNYGSSFHLVDVNTSAVRVKHASSMTEKRRESLQRESQLASNISSRSRDEQPDSYMEA